jgi:DNA-binding CsgD family transcriptional regulator
MSRQPTVLERWFAAFNAHDLDALYEIVHPGIELVPLGAAASLPPGTTYHGVDGVRSMMQPGFDQWPRLRAEPREAVKRAGWYIVPMTLVLDDGTNPPDRRPLISAFIIRDQRVVVVRAFNTHSEALETVDRTHVGALTPREREILGLVAGGMTAEQVADVLVISPFTVRTHVRNAKEKLGARTTGHAIALAMRGHQFDTDC